MVKRMSIHDICRMEPLKENDLPRFNMPFELGLDFGCKFFGAGRLGTKQCLVLEKEPYRFQKVLSDISGNGIRAHNGEPIQLVRQVRDWIKVTVKSDPPAWKRLWLRYSEFCSHFVNSRPAVESHRARAFLFSAQ